MAGKRDFFHHGFRKSYTLYSEPKRYSIIHAMASWGREKNEKESCSFWLCFKDEFNCFHFFFLFSSFLADHYPAQENQMSLVLST